VSRAVNETLSQSYGMSVTCHMGSHSVTGHPTQVNTPRLTPARGQYLIKPTPDGT